MQCLEIGAFIGRAPAALRLPQGLGEHADHAVLSLVQRGASLHDAEHGMIGVLSETLWQAQRSGRAPDERSYLEALQRL